MNGRLGVLGAVDDGVAVTEALRLALEHAVAEVGGVGGMVHVRQPGNPYDMRLLVSSGMPQAMTEPWEHLSAGSGSALSRAAHEGVHAWQHAPVPADPGYGSTASIGFGIAAVPVPGLEVPLGALSVLTAERRKPRHEEWAFLDAVAAWAASRLRRPVLPETLPPREQPARRAHLQQVPKAIGVGSWEWTIATGELVMDEAALTVLGIDPEAYDRRAETWLGIIHPDDLPWVTAELDQAVRNRGTYGTAYRVNRPDGATGWVQVHGRVELDDAGQPIGMVGTTWDTTESHSAHDTISRALRQMSDGLLILDRQWRITFLNREAERVMGAGQELVGRVVWDVVSAWRVPALRVLCQEAVADSKPTGLDFLAPGTERWYHLRLVPFPDGLAFFITDVHDKRERDAEHGAAMRVGTERTARIDELTAALARALSSKDVVDAVARHVLPAFDAAGLVVRVTVEGDRTRVVGSVGCSPAILNRISKYSASERNAGIDAMLTRTPQFFSSPQEYVARYPHLAYQIEMDGKKAWAFMPLIASDHPVGVCMLSFDRPRHFTGEERTLLVTLSGLVAQALARARLFDAEHARAQELQRGLLPQALPSLPACTCAARYLPAGQGMDVGGDWYDLIPLSGDRVALVIGDVMGHGLSEAATMGRLRTAVHTLASLELPPDEVLAHLNETVSALGDDSYATCLYAVYDPTTGICVFAHAGHPPPAIVYADGTVHFPDVAPNPPLGAAKPPFETVELPLPENSLLALYTDGLVESSSRDIDTGMARLARVLGESRDGDLDLLCEKLTADLLPAQQQADDDAALLVARIHALPAQDIAAWPLLKEPQAAGDARKLVRAQLSEWGLDDLAMTTELLVSELVGNVVRYAKGPILIRLLRSRTLICEVYDGSLTTPRIRRASETDEGGRGLQLVAALAQRWGTRYTATGKCIWTEQTLVGPEATDALLSVFGLVSEQ
jgi:serine phosphatase RsbU (regulator of sigma subunit)/PAS domain-containing protein